MTLEFDPRLGQAIWQRNASLATGQPLVPVGDPVVTAPRAVPTGMGVASHDPTVEEHFRVRMTELQEQLREMERSYEEARVLGILQVRLSTLRRMIW
jgi:hypothetical protein